MHLSSTLHAPTAGGDTGTGWSIRDGVRTLLAEFSAIGPRPRGSVGHARAIEVLEAALLERGLAPYRGHAIPLASDGGIVNLAAVIPGRERHRRPLVLASHYDGPHGSPALGDNGAAVATLVAVAPLLAEQRFERDVVLLLFDAGDADHGSIRALGAELFVRQQRRHDLKAAIVIDRIGHRPGPRQPPLLLVGAECDPRLPAALTALHRAPPEVAPVRRRALERAPAMDAFREHDIPSLWLTAGRAPHHRGPHDVSEHLDEEVLLGTAAHLVTLVAGVAATRLPGPCGDHDVRAFERRAWHRWATRGRCDEAHLERLVRRVLPRLTP